MNIIELAREAGFKVDWQHADVAEIKAQRYVAFANAVIKAHEAKLIEGAGEPEAIRHSFDGYGWMYIDNGHGSGWRGCIDKQDAEFMFTKRQVAGAVAKYKAALNKYSEDEILCKQQERIAELEAARMAYAREFSLNADGEPDVGNIHANIRAMKDALKEARLALTMTDQFSYETWMRVSGDRAISKINEVLHAE